MVDWGGGHGETATIADQVNQPPLDFRGTGVNILLSIRW